VEEVRLKLSRRDLVDGKIERNSVSSIEAGANDSIEPAKVSLKKLDLRSFFIL
jgi:hypothetical protein